jgi:predicted RNase H-like nuclease (RuvC/YqgF family)
MDFTQLKEEIKAGKYLPEQSAMLPQLPENANEEAIRINEQYKQQIEQLKLRINTLEAQVKRVDAQKKLDIQWLEETQKRDVELEHLNSALKACQEFNVSISAQLKNKDNTIEKLKKDLESAQKLATENARGQAKKLAAEVEELKKQLENNKNKKQVEWDLLFDSAKDGFSKDEVSSVISKYIMSVIVNAKIPDSELSNQLFKKTYNLTREIEDKTAKTNTINVSGDYIVKKEVQNEVGNVEPNATGIAVSK